MSDYSFESFKGKTLVSVEGGKVDDEQIRFEFDDGSIYKMHHHQDCCEYVSIESVVGDWADMIGVPILMAEESSSDARGFDQVSESGTWTFYKLATRKGFIDIRWLGGSNGYYSESVSIQKIA